MLKGRKNPIGLAHGFVHDVLADQGQFLELTNCLPLAFPIIRGVHEDLFRMIGLRFSIMKWLLGIEFHPS